VQVAPAARDPTPPAVRRLGRAAAPRWAPCCAHRTEVTQMRMIKTAVRVALKTAKLASRKNLISLAVPLLSKFKK